MAGHRFTCLRTGIYIIWKCCYLPNTRGVRTDRSERFNGCHKLLLRSLYLKISVPSTVIRWSLLHLPYTEDTIDEAEIAEALLGQVLVDVHQRIRIVTAGLVL